ncbi:MAG: purine-nucleoside phosphorylase [Limisphaerales bacterium]
MIKGGQHLNRLGDRTRSQPTELQKAANQLRRELGDPLPEMALVLGSGFQDVLDGTQIESETDVAGVPGFPEMRVQGHAGRLVVTKIAGLRLLVLAGRAHYYEGHSMGAVMYPVRLLTECGVKELFLTNAAGGINPEYQPGDFMVIRDHINFMGVNPLRELPVQDGRCFVDLTDAYSEECRALLRLAGREEALSMHEGVYIGVSGPTYETPAEIRAFRMWGADAVGMSTIPEVLMARYCGMKVAAISCITNCAAGLGTGKLSHAEVLEAGKANAARAARLIRRFVLLRQNVANA